MSGGLLVARNNRPPVFASTTPDPIEIYVEFGYDVHTDKTLFCPVSARTERGILCGIDADMTFLEGGVRSNPFRVNEIFVTELR